MKKVSVLTITYNHEQYIRETLESALVQLPALEQYGYKMEIIVADDCSTDSSSVIIRELAKRYPEVIRPILNEKNKGMMQNFADSYRMCTGEYIAFLEGDDVWTDTAKLAKQLLFLENNPDYVISSHNVLVTYEDAPDQSNEWPGRSFREVSTGEDVLSSGSAGATCSLVFRKNALPEIPEWLTKMQGGDWIIQCLVSAQGKMKYFPEVMGMYRRHAGGVSAAGNNKEKEINIFLAGGVDHCEMLNKHFRFESEGALTQNLVNYFYPNLIKILLKHGEYEQAAVFTFKMLLSKLSSGITSVEEYINPLISLGYEANKEVLSPILERLSAIAMQVKPLRKNLLQTMKGISAPRMILYIGKAYNDDIQTLAEEFPEAGLIVLDRDMKDDTLLYPLYADILKKVARLKICTEETEILELLEGATIDLLVLNDEHNTDIVSALIAGYATEKHGILFPVSYGAIICSAITIAPGLCTELPASDELLVFRYGLYDGVSVIIPCYNCEDTVEESIRSVLDQELYCSYEIVCTNDCSTDGTAALLARLAATTPQLKTVQHQVNKGGAAARNTCIENSSAGLIFCLDSDNILAEKTLNDLLCFRENTGSDAAAFEELRFFKGSTEIITHSWFFKAEQGVCTLEHILTEIQTPAASGNYLFTRESWSKAGGYPEGRGAMDAWGFGFRQHATGTNIALLPGKWYLHRLSDNSYWTRDEREGKNNKNATIIIREYAHLLNERTAAWLATTEPETNLFQAIEQKVLGVQANPSTSVKLISVPEELFTTEGDITVPLKLHLGCGERYMEGYVNIDYPPANHSVQRNTRVDLYAEITSLTFPAGSIDEIRLHHVFEHFDRATALALLVRWYDWLKPGGTLMIETPDLLASTELFLHPDISYTNKQSVLRHVFGSHEAFWAVHWDGWYEEKYAHTLTAFGYKDLKFEKESWQMTRNITVTATKGQRKDIGEQIDTIRTLLKESLVDFSESELSMLAVWQHAAERVLEKTEYLAGNPVVTVFMPVYNGSPYIAETVQSILQQSFQQIELLIGDDGSEDNTLAKARELAQHDRRIRVFSFPHKNEVCARNMLIRLAHPKSIYLLNHDSDDISLPNKFEKLILSLQANPEHSICGCLTEYFTETQPYAGKPDLFTSAEDIRANFGTVNSMVNSAAMIRREVFERIGGYREVLRSVDDYDFFARALCSGYELVNVPEVLHKIRLHDNSIGATQSDRQRKGEEVIRSYLKKYNRKPQGSPQSERKTNEMNILFTVEFYYPRTGGAERVVQQIAEYCASIGNHVTVATTLLPDRKELKHNGVTIRQFNISGSIGNGIHGPDIQAYQDFLRKPEWDIVFHYAAQQWATDLVFEVLPEVKESRVNIIAPCGYSGLLNAQTLRWRQFGDYFTKVLPYFVPMFDAAVYHSAAYQDYEYATNHRFTNSVVIQNFIKENEFSSDTPNTFKQKYGINTKYMLLCIANYVEGKGHKFLLQKFEQLHRNDTTLVCIGKEGSEYEQLSQSAPENTVLLKDIPRSETISALACTDLFVLASEIEAFPLVILEAMASNTAWIALPAGNIRELPGGIVSTPDSFSEDINMLLANEQKRLSLAEQGKVAAFGNYTEKTVLEQYIRLFKRLYERKNSPQPMRTPGADKGELLQKKIEQDYGEVSNYLEAASFCAEQNNLAEAITYLEDALELQPENTAIESMIIKLEKLLEQAPFTELSKPVNT